MERQANDPRLRMCCFHIFPELNRADNPWCSSSRFAEGYYSSSPYRYSAPMDPYRSRYDVMYGPRYGYRPGYGGYMSNGYGYGYGGG